MFTRVTPLSVSAPLSTPRSARSRNRLTPRPLVAFRPWRSLGWPIGRNQLFSK